MPVKKKRKEDGPHVETWREAAISGDKKIYFCACRSMQGDPFRGCGAVAIRYGGSQKLHVVRRTFDPLPDAVVDDLLKNGEA